jgi:hypothetical protein
VKIPGDKMKKVLDKTAFIAYTIREVGTHQKMTALKAERK